MLHLSVYTRPKNAQPCKCCWANDSVVKTQDDKNGRKRNKEAILKEDTGRALLSYVSVCWCWFVGLWVCALVVV